LDDLWTSRLYANTNQEWAMKRNSPPHGFLELDDVRVER